MVIRFQYHESLKLNLMRLVKIVLWVVYTVLLLVHLLLLYFGQASIITTFLFYITIGLCGCGISKYFFAKNSPEKYKNITLFIISSVTCLFFAEITLRYIFKTNLTYYEKSGGFFYKIKYRSILSENLIRKYWFHQSNLHLFVYKPNSKKYFDKEEFHLEFRYNSMGLRGPEPDTSYSHTNIIGLGDSFMEGFGVQEDSTWFNLFIRQLSSGDSLKNYQGINGGFSDSDVLYEYIVLRDLLLKYKPSYVILDINSSDINDIAMRGGFERFKEDGTVRYKPGPWWEYFYSFSIIFRDIIHAFYDIHWNLLTEEQNTIQAIEAEDLICDCIKDKYIQMALKNNFKLIVTFHPRINELKSKTMIFSRCKKDLKKDSSLIFIDAQEKFINEIEKKKLVVNRLYYPLDLHHTAYGNKVWADIYASEFKKIKIE